MNCKTYREQRGIGSREMINAIRPAYPRYGKSTQCMVDNPDKYGVCLVPGAVKLVERTFGQSDTTPAAGHRTKPCRAYLWLPRDMAERMKELAKRDGYKSIQDLLYALVTQWIRGRESRSEEQ